ncbi:MAG: imidazole glycerol phosphate synthase subunit HisH [Candidatus Dadabacteria bacterium]|nr:imidazole glycerol phosphate synthase subunit HisH [Candidatus Dadabacteria bacterium]
MIVIVDYGMGNLRSVEKAFHKLGFDATVTRDPELIASSPAVVLPGVGAFGRCMDNLTEYGLTGPIVEHIESGKPFLGICLGLQLLFEESEESPGVRGLGVLRGKVLRFPSVHPGNGTRKLIIPHMGWNRVRYDMPSPALDGVPEGSWFYFVHSYYPAPADEDVVAGVTEYGVEFASAVQKGSLFASQFHPEKSGAIGLRILKNFGEMVEGIKT